MSSLQSSITGKWPVVDGSGFGEPFDTFPVEARFAVRPDLVKLAPADDWLRVDRQWPQMVAAKLAASAGDDCSLPADNIMLASACDEATEQARFAAVRRICDTLAATAAGRRLGIAGTPEGVEFGAAGYRAALTGASPLLQPDRDDAAPVVQALGGGSDALLLLGALAMSLQEDLVLMEQAPDGLARAALFHVSFPSAWNPSAKVGQDLLALHAPVADNDSLQAAAPRLGQALLAKGPFVRWVWTVTEDPRWRAWPPQRPGATPSPLYFRLERQTTLPLGEGYGLFLIRVQVRPLDDVLAVPGRLALLQASLRSMSDDIVRYKNLGAVRSRILSGR